MDWSFRNSLNRLEIHQHLGALVIEIISHLAQTFGSERLSHFGFRLIGTEEHKKSAAARAHDFSAKPAAVFHGLVPAVKIGVADFFRTALLVLPVLIQQKPEAFKI